MSSCRCSSVMWPVSVSVLIPASHSSCVSPTSAVKPCRWRTSACSASLLRGFDARSKLAKTFDVMSSGRDRPLELRIGDDSTCGSRLRSSCKITFCTAGSPRSSTSPETRHLVVRRRRLGPLASRAPARRRRLYLPLQHSTAGSVFHAVAEQGVRTRDVADVIGRHLSVHVISIPPDTASERFGWMGAFCAAGVPSLERAHPRATRVGARAPELIADLEAVHCYARRAVA